MAMDDQTMALQQQNAIIDEQRMCPLVSSRLPLSGDPMVCALASEVYGNQNMTVKLRDSITRDYGSIRYIRRDGSCFYRAAMFGLLEAALLNSAVLESLRGTVAAFRNLIVGRFSDYAEDFCDVLTETLNACASGAIQDPTQLLKHVTSDEVSEYLLFFFRYAVSCYLVNHEEEFLVIVQALHAYPSMDAYCKAEVEVVAHDSDHLHLAAFVNSFNVSLHIECLDSTPGSSSHDMEPSDGVPITRIHLLFRPGHYDLIYPRD